MAFFEQRMNPDLSFGAQGGPVFSTSRAITIGGYEKVNQNWSSPLHRYNVQHCIKTQADFDEILAFFYVVAGAYDGFRFKDWNDYTDDGRGVCTLVTGSTYQMFKRYTIGSRTFNRKISKPVAGVQVFRTRSAVTTNITGSSTITTSTGEVVVTSHQAGDTYTWTGEFDVPVRFASDELLYTIVNKSGSQFLIDSGPINLMEVRL
jgi:uncharacterized protein (TIGR02217 family)